jgi:hypothetical protein
MSFPFSVDTVAKRRGGACLASLAFPQPALSITRRRPNIGETLIHL